VGVPDIEEFLPDGYGSLGDDLDLLAEHLRTEDLLQDGRDLPEMAPAGPTVNHTML